MQTRARMGVAALGVLVVALALVPGGAGKTGRRLGGQCGTAPCWTTFTVNGSAPPAGIALTLTSTGGNIMVSISNSGQTDLSPALTTSDTIHMVLNLGTYDPVVFGTTGLVSSYSESTGASNTITLDVKPSASSWKSGGCSVSSCGSDANPVTASNDFSSVVLGFVSDLTSSGASASTITAMRGTWFSTNAQAMALPSFSNGSVKFTVAAPHFKTNGVTQNTGFFEFFAPDALVQSMGIADPSSVTNGSFSLTNSNGGSTTFDVSHQASPAGVLIKAGTNPPSLPMFNYSSPTYTVSKAATVAGAPTSVSASRGDGSAVVSFSAPASSGGAAITSYTVTASPGGATASGSGSPITVSGLSNGTSYTFTVTATNSVGTGPASSASGAVTPAGRPGTPAGVTATPGDKAATISFDPAFANGSAISSYTVTASPGGASASGSGSPITVPELSDCTAYTFTVSATNDVGASGESSPSAAVVPGSASCATVNTRASATADAAGSLAVPAPVGAPAAAAATVAWQAGTFAGNVDVGVVTEAVTAASTPATLAGFSAGSVAVDVTITGGGSAIHSFGAPLDVVFPQAAAGVAPSWSDDGGATWASIPPLPGTTLPDGQADGYYRDAAGSIHVLTRHATVFALVGGLVLKTGNRPTFPVGSRRIFVFLAPERRASAVVELETRHGVVLRTLRLTLPPRTTRLKIPLPGGLAAGLYLVNVVATSGPGTAKATLLVRLVP